MCYCINAKLSQGGIFMTINETIQHCGFVSHQLRSSYFAKMDLSQIREWLEFNGLNRHIPIETYSTEIALCTPSGVIMQVKPSDNNALCMWGGEINCGEAPIDGAVRELFEETGIKAKSDQLMFKHFIKHEHTYANGNVVLYNSYRYVLKLSNTPIIILDPESSGYCFISTHSSEDEVKKILPVQRKFILSVAQEYCS